MTRRAKPGRAMHRLTPELRALGEAILAAALDRLAADPPELGQRAGAVGGRRARGRDDHAGGARGRGGARALPRRAAPADHRDRPPALPRVHPVGADAGLRADRPAAQRQLDLRRLVDGGRRRRARRERGAALGRGPRRPARPARAAASSRAAPTATSPRCTRRASAPARAARPPRHVACSEEVHSSVRASARIMDAQVLPVPAEADGRLRGDALRAALDRRRVRGRGHRRHHQPRPRRRPRGRRRRHAASATCGCTSTAPTAPPGCARRASASGSRGSSTPTR